MKSVRNLFIVTAALSLMIVPAYAKDNGKKNPWKGPIKLSMPKKPEKIRMSLAPFAGLPADLAQAKGSADGMVGKNKTELRVLARIPIPSASLLLSDVAAARAANIRMEISRGGQVANDCKLAFASDPNEAAPTRVGFRLHAKDRGKQFVKGSCVNGLPIMSQKLGDKVVVYTVVNSLRVDILGNPAALAPTTTPTPAPTATPAP